MAEYGIFLLKAITIVVAIIVVFAFLASLSMRQRKSSKGHIEVTKLNERLKSYKELMQQSLLSKDELKKHAKEEKKQAKAKKKQASEPARKRVFVINFEGDTQASAVENLREEVTTVLSTADKKDEVVVKVESPGGTVHGYGLAASQLSRIKDQGVNLTVCVDKVAASGGYMMACVADKILSAPFAILGSIGVVAQLPNFNRFLKKHDVDFELHTAGEYKRTLTVFGENTDEGREKFQSDLESIHRLFKDFVKKNRSQLDLDEVAHGDFWFGQDAMEKNLVDRICTSDQYLQDLSANSDIFEVTYKQKKSIQDRLGVAASVAMEKTLFKVAQRWNWIS